MYTRLISRKHNSNINIYEKNKLGLNKSVYSVNEQPSSQLRNVVLGQEVYRQVNQNVNRKRSPSFRNSLISKLWRQVLQTPNMTFTGVYP